ncbi:MAG TPA: histidine--tRNA ligase [Alphaproteobacteria bacterium]|nr:histidine--tRNA ligase [Alphaproteobacteria bacterium]
MTTPLKPRLPRGFEDANGPGLDLQNRIITILSEVYARYGFDRLTTPAIEFADALGKFLPDQDRPNEGVFSFRDDDEQWLCLRYDLTAPLARYVAENYERLSFPFRRFQTGSVFRNEKPGPGRFREFVQFDADTVGSANMAADTEFCMLVADALEALGLNRGDYAIKINNRKVLNGILECAGIAPGAEGDMQRLTVLRAMDKLDRLGVEGVRMLLGKGRKDESGDFTKGAGLEPQAIDRIVSFLQAGTSTANDVCSELSHLVEGSAQGQEGVAELSTMRDLLTAARYQADRVRIDPSVVRGLAYYTGPVFEAELTFEIKDEDGRAVRFGSIGGGGRYDDLVERFLGKKVPATGVSIGVSRLAAALKAKGLAGGAQSEGPVVVLVLDRDQLPGYQAMVSELRGHGVRAELYLGEAGMKAQMKYADRRGAPLIVIEGSNERASGQLTIKDLRLGAKLSADIASREEWAKAKDGQQWTITRSDLVNNIKAKLGATGA